MIKLVPGTCQEIHLLFMTYYHHIDMQDASGWREGLREEYLSAYSKVKYGAPHHNSHVDEIQARESGVQSQQLIQY